MLVAPISILMSHFHLADGRLYRLYDSGEKEITSYSKGRLVHTFDGQPCYAAEIAWALIYKVLPKYPVLVIDGDETNLTAENLAPVISKHWRFRLTKFQLDAGKAYKHPLSPQLFSSPELARVNWNACVRLAVAADKERVLLEQGQELAERGEPVPVERKEVRAKREPAVSKLRRDGRPRKPAAGPGQVAVWWQDAWLIVPEAVHPSDDLHVRCAAVLAGATGFVFDAEKQMTVALYEQEATAAQEGDEPDRSAALAGQAGDAHIVVESDAA